MTKIHDAEAEIHYQGSKTGRTNRTSFGCFFLEGTSKNSISAAAANFRLASLEN